MPNASFILESVAPFTRLPFKSGKGCGVLVRDRDGLGLATVLVRKGKRAELAQQVRKRFGLELPDGPRRAAAGDVAWAGTGPDSWLVTQEKGGNGFAIALKQTLADLASVSDQSDGYAVLRVSGPKVRDALAKLIPIDLHPAAFKVGAVASTVAAFMGVTLWRLADGIDGSPVFEIAVFRSLAADFWHALNESAAEFGFVTAQP